jgi:hypothetical protein
LKNHANRHGCAQVNPTAVVLPDVDRSQWDLERQAVDQHPGDLHRSTLVNARIHLYYQVTLV